MDGNSNIREDFLKSRPPRIVHSTKVEISTVAEYLASGKRSERAGVILLTTFNSRTNFCLGIYKNNELTDFGGTVFPWEDSISAALREFHEETLGIFGKLHLSQVMDCIVIHNSYNLVLFLRYAIDPILVCRLFSNKITSISPDDSELIGIMFFAEREFNRKLHSTKEIYHRLAFFLCEAGDFFKFL